MSPQPLSWGSTAGLGTLSIPPIPAHRSGPAFSYQASPKRQPLPGRVFHGPLNAPQHCSHSTTVTSRGDAG